MKPSDSLFYQNLAANNPTFLATNISLRQYFAIHAPPPTESDISFQAQLDLSRNPYNEPDRPPRRSPKQIEVDLRYQYADLMLARQ